jgi:hypothetical protein
MSRKIFISHAHKDKLFIDFVNEFLLPKALSDFTSDEISFTSDKDRLRGKISGQDNLKLLDEVAESELFICCISKHYNSSPFCILEHGIAYHKFYKDSSSIKLFPILGHNFKHNESLITVSTVQHALLERKESLIDLFDTLSNIFPSQFKINKTDYIAGLNTWYSNYNTLNRAHNKPKGKKDELLEKVVNSFPENSDVDFPVTIFCNRSEYENLSIELANKANQLLIWTLYKSPLLVKDAYNIDFLTKYDKVFRDSKAHTRYRLVIFEDFKMAEEYFKCDKNTLKTVNTALGTCYKLSEIKKRKISFEQSNVGILYFTTKEKIQNWYKKEISNGKDIPDYFDYEFGFLANSISSNSYLGFTSGFHSNTGNFSKTLKKHMIFYPKVIDGEINNEFNERKIVIIQTPRY